MWKTKMAAMAAILDFWLGPFEQFLKRVPRWPFLQSFKNFWPVVSEEMLFKEKSWSQMEDGNKSSKEGCLAAILDGQSAPFEET